MKRGVGCSLSDENMFEFEKKLKFYKNKVQALLNQEQEKTLSTVLLYLNSGYCNQDCIYCDKNFYDIKTKTFSKDILINILEDMCIIGADSLIILGEGGEPIIDKNLTWFINEAVNRNIHCGIYTNGSIVNEDIITTFNRMDFVRVSLDAGTKEIHSIVHGYNSERMDFENAINLLAALDKSRVSVGAAFIIVEKNINDLFNAWKILNNMGIEYLEIKLPLMEKYQYSEVDDNMRKKILEQLDKIEKSKNKVTKIIYNKHFELFINNKIKVTDLTKFSATPCYTCSFRTIISPLGYYLCSPLKNSESYCFGDPYSERLRDAWKSSKRKKLVGRQCSIRCTYYRQNEVLNEIIKKGNIKEIDTDNIEIKQRYFL